MFALKLIQPLTLSPWGPWVSDGPVHLRQGDADGACGPYCVLMALMTLGLVGWEKVIEPKRKDRRTRLGRMWSTFGELGPLACHGSDDEDLYQILAAFGPAIAVCHPQKFSRKALQDFILGEIANNHPVIVGIETESGSRHWVLAVGQGAGDTETHLLILDPSCEVSAVTAWNAVITLSDKRVKYPADYWSQSQNEACVLETALSVALQQ